MFPNNVRIPVVSVPCHQHCHSPVSNSDCAHVAGLSPGILSKFVQCVDSVSVAKIGGFLLQFFEIFSFPRLCLQFPVVGSTAVFQGAATAVWFHFVFVVVGHRTVFRLHYHLLQVTEVRRVSTAQFGSQDLIVQ